MVSGGLLTGEPHSRYRASCDIEQTRWDSVVLKHCQEV